MQKERAAWFCFHASLLLAECSRSTACAVQSLSVFQAVVCWEVGASNSQRG